MAKKQTKRTKTKRGKAKGPNILEKAGAMSARINAVREASRRYGGPAGASVVTQVVNETIDQWKCLELRSRGLTWHQVGQQMGCSHHRARQLVLQAAGELHLRTPAMVRSVLAAEDMHLNELRRAMVPLVHGQVPQKTTLQKQTVNGKKVMVPVPVPNDPLEVARLQTMAVTRAVSISERLAKMHGVDAPTKVAPVTPDGDAPYESMDLGTLEKLVAEGMAELGLDAIDVTPEQEQQP